MVIYPGNEENTNIGGLEIIVRAMKEKPYRWKRLSKRIIVDKFYQKFGRYNAMPN